MTPASGNAGPALGEGTKIGGCYVLRRNLSKPGARPVWVASDEVLGKDVTLHFVPAEVAADARAMTELRQEVKRNRQLIHPNILRVYDFVEDGSHVAISMDEFEGESLGDVLKRKGTLDPADLKPWIAQLAETLADAHRIQLFHRDLSPENIYLRPNGGMLVANFGISRVILNSLERAGLAKGAAANLAYLSPQQIDGDRPNASDDIYGLGVLMHTLLAGSPPFGGEDMVPQIRKTVPPPISALRAAAGASAPVSASWEKLITTCLDKSPDARPRNLADVLTLLGQDSGPARAQGTQADTAAAEKIIAGAVAHSAAAPDAPATPSGQPDGGANGASTRKPAETTLPAEGEPPSAKSQHPEFPPIAPRPAARKTPVKGALSANFPDLDRPRSKAPLVWLLLAAGIIGGGIYLRNKPEPADADGNGGVTRIDGSDTPDGGALPPNTTDGTVTSSKALKSPDRLPEPEPVKPTKTVPGSQTLEAPKTGTTGEPPKIASATPPQKPAKSGLIGGETAPATQPGDLAPIAPTSLDGASAQGGKTTPAARVSPPVKTPTTAPEMTGTKAPINVATSVPVAPPEKTPAPEVRPTVPNVASQTPKPVSPTAKPQPLPKLPDPISPLQKLVLPEKATVAQLDEVKRQREAAAQSIRSAGAIADAAHLEATRRLETAKAEKDKRQKALDAKRKTFAPVIHEAEALVADRKKFEDEVAKALAAAAEATKQAEAGKRKLEETIAKGGEKLQAREKAEGELNAGTAELSATAKEVEDISQVLDKADAIRMQAKLTQQQAEQDLQKIATATDKAQRAEKETQRKANLGKIAAIEKQISDLKAQSGRFDATIEPLKELGDAGKEAIRKIEEKKGAAQKHIGDLQAEIKRLSEGGGTLPVKETGAVTALPVVPVAEIPDKTPAPGPETVANVNSLSMKFVPVGDVQFSVYLTTVKDFGAFASAAGLKSDAWRNPGFKQSPDHPVVNVTWREAEAFCKWLTDKERKAGLLKAGEAYRLPTDLEWSKAVGLPPETGATPEDRDMGVPDVYPWGNQWPPPAGAGNYAGEETQTEIPIPDYNDGYPNTSPVGKFRVNAAGLYDMGGNVWQWVADSWNGENRAKTLRGGSWYNGAIQLSLQSSCRISSSPDTLHDTYGFRIVKAIVKAAEGAKPHRRN